MCKDCGCSIVEQRESHSHEHHEDAHEHNHGDSHHEHHHEGHHGSHKHLHDNPQLNDPKTISIISKILDKNDHEAGHNRERF